MSKKGLKTMLVCIVLLIGLVTLFACNKSDVADKDGQTKVIVKIQDEDGSIYKENVVFSDLFTLSLQKEGYTGRLYRDEDFLKPLTKDSKVKNGDTVYVKWTINSYTVTFMDGKTVLKTEKVQHGSAATAPEVPKKDGKTFKEWDKGFSTVTSDLTINAVYDVDKFTLMFINFDGTTVYTEEVEYGASIEDAYNNAVEKVDIEGPFEYDGWYEVGDETTTLLDENNLPEMPARNVTYKLKLKLTLSAIGDNTAITVPGGFTYGEKSATFTVSGDTHDGVNYEYEWTILKDGKEYKKQTTTSGSITIENPDAGTYVASVKVVASKEGCGSVENDFTADKTLIVSRADISGITVKGGTFTYGDENAKIKIDGLKDGDKVFYGTDNTNFPLQNVDLSVLDYGEHDYYVRVERGDNYNPYTSGKITVKIDKAKVTATVTPDKDTLRYGDNLPSLTATINGETYTIESGKYELHFGYTKITGNVANNVGTYNIENVDISVLRTKYPDKNYEIKVETVGTITINEADLTVTVSLDKTELTYGEALPKITYKFDGLKLSDTESDFTRTETEFAEKLDVGTYTAEVTLSGEKTNFYNITVNAADFTVKQRKATITINAVDNIIYGDKVPDLSAKVEVKGVLDGDSLSYTLNPNYEVGNKPGDYTASVVFDENAAENKNYAITATGRTFTVVQKKLTIKLNNTNTATVALGKTYTVNAEHLEKIGLVAGDTVTGHVTITKDVKGTYYADDFDKFISVKNAKGDYVTKCYEIAYEMSVEFVEVKFAIDFADVTLTYDGQPHGVSVTAKEGTSYTITYGESAENCNLEESPKYTNAGPYTIYFKVVDNETQADYAGSVTLTINKKAVEIKVKDATITYGETPKFEYTVTGLVEGENLSGEAVYSGAGTDAGVYDISVSGLSASNNYNVLPFVSGKLTINKKEAKVDWTIAENYVYSPDGQTLPTATYDGKTANLIFTKDGTVCDFKNAGTYTVTIKEDKNYILSGETTKTIVIEKATYTSVTAHEALSGIYDPNKTLGNYTLAEGFTWADANETPDCTKTEYAAKYNMDSDNYEDFATTVTLVLQKATVTLAQDLFEFNYDNGASYEISTTVRYNNIEVTEPYTLTFEKNMFSDAGTHKTTATLTSDNFALSDNVVYVKVKGVKVGNNYYTIEDALDVAKEGQTIFVLNDTAFATQEIAGVLYNDVKFKTVKTGVTLLLPFNENDTVGHIGAGEDGSPNYKATAALTGTAKLYKTLVIPEGVEVIVNGKLVVGAQTGKIDAGQKQNAVSGNYCEITLEGTITLNNATLEVYGYIKGNGEITANNTTVIENLYLSGWLGGSESAARYVGNREIGVGDALSDELKIDTPNMFPFSQYELRAIQSRVIINKGSKLQGYTKIATGEVDIKISKIKAQINEALLTFISSDASNASSGLFRLVGNNSKIVKSMSGDRVRFDLYGEVNDGYTSISIKVVKATVKMASEKVFFPIDGRTDITLKNGATFTQSYMFKALPGATITVESGSVYNVNGKLVMYDRSFTEKGYPGAARGDAKLIVNGTMNVNGALGGNVTSDNAGTVAVGANATITNIKSIEGNGSLTIDKGMLINAKVILHFTESGSVTKSLVFVNAGNSTVAAATNKTYNYNNGTWQ